MIMGLRSRLALILGAITLGTGISYHCSASRADWQPVSDHEASDLIGGQTSTKCLNWTTINCPTPKKNCSDFSCFGALASGAIENKKGVAEIPCGTGDSKSKDFCPDVVNTYIPCK
jgi:hypothetical protein